MDRDKKDDCFVNVLGRLALLGDDLVVQYNHGNEKGGGHESTRHSASRF